MKPSTAEAQGILFREHTFPEQFPWSTLLPRTRNQAQGFKDSWGEMAEIDLRSAMKELVIKEKGYTRKETMQST